MSDKTILLQEVMEKAQKWLAPEFDESTRKQVQHLIDNEPDELIESFYRTLEFGTGGLRGIMGVGTNRMNIYTVGMATQGLCNYLIKNFPNEKQIKVVIARDCRNNGELFAQTAAGIFSANGFKVYLFDDLRPTPELSFAIRHFNCQSGIVLTASHNPKEYNGYKAYWSDGAQMIEPHDTNVIAEVEKITSIAQVKFDGPKENIEIIGHEIDEIYVNELKKLSLSPEAIAANKDLKIVYTPIHGTGVKLTPMALKAFGFENVTTVKEQDVVDGNFPTVVSPNPENAEALKMALAKADEIGADLVMATDPDSDRVGIAVRNHSNQLVLLNGNQTATLLIYYLITKWKENGKLLGKEYIVKTIVTTELLVEIAQNYGVAYHDVLTGFKYIADIIEKKHGKENYIGGGEESYGFLAGEFVRDKDAIMACALIAETAAWAKHNGKTLYELLIDIYSQYHLYYEGLVNITKKGKAGAEEISAMMHQYRTAPPKEINGSQVIMIKDYEFSVEKDLLTGKEKVIELPKSNVLQFFLADGTKISIRPSGTEPKIKFYFGVKEKLKNKQTYETEMKDLVEKVNIVAKSMNLN